MKPTDPSLIRHVFGMESIQQTLSTVCPAITVLLIVVKPEATAGYDVLWRSLFWVSHMTVGATIAVGIASITAKLSPLLPSGLRYTLVLIIATGVVGAIIAAPIFEVLEGLFPPQVNYAGNVESQPAEPWVAIWAEFKEAAPTFVAIWLCVNLPVLIAKPVTTSVTAEAALINTQSSDTYEVTATPNKAQDNAELITKRDKFIANLPLQLGNDVVAVSSDLHYINVYTTQGKTLILGSLKHVTEIFADEGMMVHRSHWVRKKHVRQLRFGQDHAHCEMSNELHIPISRSKRKTVKDNFSHLDNRQSLRHQARH